MLILQICLAIGVVYLCVIVTKLFAELARETGVVEAVVTPPLVPTPSPPQLMMIPPLNVDVSCKDMKKELQGMLMIIETTVDGTMVGRMVEGGELVRIYRDGKLCHVTPKGSEKHLTASESDMFRIEG
jgi:hypothetical protein